MSKILLIVSVFFFGCTQAREDLVVMSYNVENFFDAVDNPETDDETYLPLKHPQKKKCKAIKSKYYKKVCQKLDWTPKKIELKVSQHLKVLEAFPHQLDLLALIEVESKEVVELFKEKLPLKGMVMTDGSDRRGINVALLFNESRFSLKNTKQIVAPFKTRNILKVQLEDKKNKKPISVYINHWPSQRSPTSKRLQVANLLMESLKKEKSDVIVLGDFNTLDKEFPSPFSPLRSILVDASSDYSGPGSYFYKRTMSWNMLDRIFYSSGLVLKSFGVFAPSFSIGVTEYTRKGPFKGSRIVGLPKGYDHHKKKKPGYSDHFPVYGIFSGK